jgi:DNA-binding response OmpR family regulator
VTTRIAILAQDLIWSDRLARAVQSAGAEPDRTRSAAEFDRALAGADFAIIDLTAHAYDPLVAIERARSAGARVLAVGQHDDVALRKRALALGAERVYAYRKLFEDGSGTIAGWLERQPLPKGEEAST